MNTDIIIPAIVRLPKTEQILESGDIIRIMDEDTKVPEGTDVVELQDSLSLHTGENNYTLLEKGDKFYVCERVIKLRKINQLLKLDVLPSHFTYKDAMYRLARSTTNVFSDYLVLNVVPSVTYEVMPETTLDKKVKKRFTQGELHTHYQVNFGRKGLGMVATDVSGVSSPFSGAEANVI